MKLYTVIVLLNVYQNTLRNFQKSGILRHYLKECENLDLLETRQMIYLSKGNDELFENAIFIELSDWIKSYGHFGIF